MSSSPIHKVRPARKEMVLPVMLTAPADVGCGCVEWVAIYVAEDGSEGPHYSMTLTAAQSAEIDVCLEGALYALVGLWVGYDVGGARVMARARIGGPIADGDVLAWAAVHLGALVADFESGL